MCGIVGVFHTQDGPPVSRAVIERLCDTIAHRGPDDVGTFVEGRCGLGVRRLAVIDLAGGHQPVFNENGRCTLVFNGEIYNYRQLRSDLTARGHLFRTESDTESIIHLYEELGAGCVEKLRGMFAFAIWDAGERKLTLARDRFGIKPLYVVQADWGIAFASELKALVQSGITDRSLDWNALDMFFQLGYIPAPHSPFRDVRKLEPGHVLEWRDSGVATVRRYWDLPSASANVPDRIEDKVLSWLDDSVQAHLVSDVPVAVFLSGGIDSSAVVASMAAVGETPHAFTARFHGTGAAQTDETGLARELADRYGAKLTIIDVHPDVTTTFEQIIWALDEPHADESAIPTWAISQAVSGSYKVALMGTGGDELFGGYHRHIGSLLGGYYSKLPSLVQNLMRAVAQAVPEPRDGGMLVDRAKRFLRTVDSSTPDRIVGYANRVGDGLRSRLYADDVATLIRGNPAREHFRSCYRDGGSREGLSAALHLDYCTYLPDDILALSDRLAMAHSLEVRVPFVDHHLVENVFPLPDRVKIGPLTRKRLLRQALRTRLPEAHFAAPKRGFVGPSATWLRAELRELLSDELSAARMDRIGFFRTDTVAALLDDHFSRRHNRAGILWALMCFANWHHQYVEDQTAPAYEPVLRQSSEIPSGPHTQQSA